MRQSLILAVAAALLGCAGTASAESLNLVCRGETQAYGQSAAGAAALNPRTAPATGFGSSVRIDRRPDEFRVRIDGNVGAVMPPPALIPWLTGKGLGDGWWAFDEVIVSPDRISGAYSHSLIYSPRVTIDRRSGAITVRPLVGDEFSGSCEPAPAGDPPRRF